MKYDHGSCSADDHDRDPGPDGPDAQPRDHSGLMLCRDCGASLLYCRIAQDYDHADPNTPPCFLVR